MSILKLTLLYLVIAVGCLVQYTYGAKCLKTGEITRYNITGPDYPRVKTTLTPWACQKLCFTTTLCEGFSWQRTSKKCYLKSKYGSVKTKSSGYLSGPKTCDSGCGEVTCDGEDRCAEGEECVVIKPKCGHKKECCPHAICLPSEDLIPPKITRECREDCPVEYSPVCGTDYKTYSNPCTLEAAHCRSDGVVKLLYPGRCMCVIPCTRHYAPVCGTDGNTYGNTCTLMVATCESDGEITKKHSGECKGTDTCVENADCDWNKVCRELICVDPCVGGCGINATCSVSQHNAICSCPDNHTGDPAQLCTEISPIGDVECVGGNDCTCNETCIKGECVELCTRGACGVSAECKVINHIQACSCPYEYTGDPMEECCPEICRLDYDAVCGNDSMTYSNLCLLEYASCHSDVKIRKKHEGQCKDKECPEVCAEVFNPVCGTDGETYSNTCELEKAACKSDVRLRDEGPCSSFLRAAVSDDGPRTEKTGVLSSPNFGRFPYPNYMDKTWEIQVPGATRYKLQFKQFQTEKIHDQILIYRNEVSADNLEHALSGALTDEQKVILITCTKLIIKMETDGTVGLNGFKMRYEAMFGVPTTTPPIVVGDESSNVTLSLRLREVESENAAIKDENSKLRSDFEELKSRFDSFAGEGQQSTPPSGEQEDSEEVKLLPSTSSKREDKGELQKMKQRVTELANSVNMIQISNENIIRDVEEVKKDKESASGEVGKMKTDINENILPTFKALERKNGIFTEDIIQLKLTLENVQGQVKKMDSDTKRRLDTSAEVVFKLQNEVNKLILLSQGLEKSVSISNAEYKHFQHNMGAVEQNKDKFERVMTNLKKVTTEVKNDVIHLQSIMNDMNVEFTTIKNKNVKFGTDFNRLKSSFQRFKNAEEDVTGKLSTDMKSVKSRSKEIDGILKRLEGTDDELRESLNRFKNNKNTNSQRKTEEANKKLVASLAKLRKENEVFKGKIQEEVTFVVSNLNMLKSSDEKLESNNLKITNVNKRILNSIEDIKDRNQEIALKLTTTKQNIDRNAKTLQTLKSTDVIDRIQDIQMKVAKNTKDIATSKSQLQVNNRDFNGKLSEQTLQMSGVAKDLRKLNSKVDENIATNKETKREMNNAVSRISNKNEKIKTEVENIISQTASINNSIKRFTSSIRDITSQLDPLETKVNKLTMREG